LHKIVDDGSGLSFAQDNTVQQLMQQKDTLSNQVKQQDEQIQELKKEQAIL